MIPARAASGALVALLITLGPVVRAHASPSWEIVVQGDDVVRFTVAGFSVAVGADDEVEVQLAGLAPRHCVLSRNAEGGKVTYGVMPLAQADVFLNDRRVAHFASFGPRDELRVGRYRLRAIESTDCAEDPACRQLHVANALTFSSAADVDVVAAAAKAAEARTDEFKQRAYRFCHDEAFGRDDPRAVEALCALLDEQTADACPAARESCPWGATAAARPDGRAWRIIPGDVLRYGFIVALVIVVAWFAMTMLKAGLKTGEPAAPPGEPRLLDVQRLPDARGTVLIRRAHETLVAGDARRAAVLTHLAILRHLDDTGLARFHASKTNGEYIRAIRGHRPLQRLFRRISGQTERIRFGDGQVDPQEVQAVIDDAPAVLRAPTKNTAGPSGAVAGLVLLALSTPAGCRPLDERPYHSHEPEGMAALPALLRATGLEVDVGRWAWADLPTDAGLTVLRTGGSPLLWWALHTERDALAQLGTVLIVDDAVLADNLFNSTRSRPNGRANRATTRLALRAAPGPCVPPELAAAELPPAVGLRDWVLEVLPPDRTVTSSISRGPVAMVPMLGTVQTRSTGGYSALWAARPVEARGACMYLLTQEALLTNASLTRPDNAAVVGALFASLAGSRRTVRLADLVTGGPQGDIPEMNSAQRALQASNLLPFLLQALVTLLVLLLAVGAAFGPLRDPVVSQHKAFVEHVEALGQHYARAGRRGLSYAATVLARFVMNRNRERGGTAGGWPGLVRDLANKHGLPEEDVRAALRLAAEETSELGPPAPEDPPAHSERILRTLSRLLASAEPGRAPATSQTPFGPRKPKDP